MPYCFSITTNIHLVVDLFDGWMDRWMGGLIVLYVPHGSLIHSEIHSQN